MHAVDEAKGSDRHPGLLHWTVLPLGALQDIQCEEWSILAALAGVYAEPFTLVFERVVCFEGGTAALTVGRTPPAVRKLREALTEALTSAGAKLSRAPSRPHVTLDYRWQGATVSRKVEPIVWNIDHVLLVESVTGKARHNHLGRRMLVPRQGTLFPLRRCDMAAMA